MASPEYDSIGYSFTSFASVHLFLQLILSLSVWVQSFEILMPAYDCTDIMEHNFVRFDSYGHGTRIEFSRPYGEGQTNFLVERSTDTHQHFEK